MVLLYNRKKIVLLYKYIIMFNIDIVRGIGLMVECLLCTQKVGVRFPDSPLFLFFNFLII